MVDLLRTTEKLPELPPKGQHLFEQIFSGEFLGASRNIRMINDMFCAIAEEWPKEKPGLVTTLLELGDFLRRTRGKNTPAIGNAIGLFLHNLQSLDGHSARDTFIELQARRTTFNAQSLQRIDAIAEVGANLLEGASTILVFDYSSSVQSILNKVAERGRSLRVVVPESRVLDGGRPFVNESTGRGHHVIYTLDMAFAHFMRACEAVLIGAETIFANGDAWNTIGSYPVALVAQRFHVPFYVATELIKIDPGSFLGISRQVQLDDFGFMLRRERLEKPELVDTMGPELDQVPSELITSYITPLGVMLPQHVRAETMKFLVDSGMDPLQRQNHEDAAATRAEQE